MTVTPVAGPFYLAYAVPEDKTFRTTVHGTYGASHLRMDEFVFDYSLSQSEGNFALLTMTILNPNRPMLSDPTKQWAHFAYDDGTNGPRALFFGHVLAVPDDMRSTLLSVTFRGKPADFDTLKAALAQSLRTLPEYDPLMLTDEARSEDDAVLQARTDVWHIDRVSGALTVSDKIDGEDGTLNYAEHEVMAGTLRQRRGEQPPRKCSVEATFSFTQAGTGQIDLSARLCKEFDALAPSPVSGTIMSYSAEGLIRDWPVPGDEIGSGWKFTDTNIEEGNGRFVPFEVVLAYTLEGWVSNFDKNALQLSQASTEAMRVAYVPGLFKPTLVVGYTAERSYTEILRFDLYADLQSVTADDPEPLRLSFSSSDLAEPIDFEESDGGSAPIGDRRRNSYLLTDRGKQTAQNVLLRTRAAMLDAARAISTDFEVFFGEIFNITLRKNAAVTTDRLPGGLATGKIIGYENSGNGDTGIFTTTLTIGSCVGKGNAVVAVEGAGIYIDNDYINPRYHVQENQVDLLPPGDVTLTDYGATTINDDGVNLFQMNEDTCVVGITIANNYEEQQQTIQSASGQLGEFTDFSERTTNPTSFGGWPSFSFVSSFGESESPFGLTAGMYQDLPDAAAPLVTSYTTVTLEMVPLAQEPVTTIFEPTASMLMVPRQVDLES